MHRTLRHNRSDKPPRGFLHGRALAVKTPPPRPPPTHAAMCGGGYGMKGEQKKVGFVLSVYAPGFTSRGGNVPEWSRLALAVDLANDL